MKHVKVQYYRYYDAELTSILFFLLKQYYLVFLQVAMSLLKCFCIDSNKESDEVPASSSAHVPFPAKRQKTIPKKRKWNEDYINYEFFRPEGEEENSYPPAQCLINYRNANVVEAYKSFHKIAFRTSEQI